MFMFIKAPPNLIEIVNLSKPEILKLRMAQLLANVAVFLTFMAYLYPVLHIYLKGESLIGTLSIYDMIFIVQVDVIVSYPLYFITFLIIPLIFALIILFNLTLSKQYLSGLATTIGFFAIFVSILMFAYEFAMLNSIKGIFDVGITGIDPKSIQETRLGDGTWFLLSAFGLLLLALKIYSEEIKTKIDSYYTLEKNKRIMEIVLKDDKAYV